MWSRASAQLYLFRALHPKGICHSILLPMIPELHYNHRHWEHLHILVLLETESWPCPVLLFWKLSIRRTLPVSQMPLLTQWREHGANICHSTRKWAGYWGCRLLSPTEPSHRSGRAPHMLSLGIDCVFFLLSLDQALSQPNIFSNKE